MLADVEKELLNSELAVYILGELAKEESYGSEIARNLNRKQSSISRIISKLQSAGLVKESRRNKAQYYEIDYEGLSNLFFQALNSTYIENSESREKLAKRLAYSENLEEWRKEEEEKTGEEISPESFFQSTLEEEQEEIKNFAKKYYNQLFPTVDDTIGGNENFDLEGVMFKSMLYNIVRQGFHSHDTHPPVLALIITPTLMDYLGFYTKDIDIEQITEELEDFS